MDIVIGGAYQGKRQWAMAQFSLTDSDIFTCKGASIATACRCVEHLERYILACMQAGIQPSAEGLAEKIILCDDISCGIVPMDALDRAWREQTGRFLTQLCGRADTVTRLFCGLPLPLKG